ncbi:hypothetical protein [Flavobacterium coralii]|uniref:hypothetical protein n=1 Tax=Flavobacterium coralii TaxID=2838017 RepID=UPI000C3FE69B|nr:hypothetical protein [Flavobacterium sp.]|tara:strand:+ start:1457 stop:1783 length:327 start_codon:yes stop_codon:yes gene_type:complete
MTANAKTNGQNKKETATPTKEVQQKLAQEAVTTAPVTAPKAPVTKPPLDERLAEALTELSEFNYNSGDSCTFVLQDNSGLEFKTTNTNLIKLFATEPQNTQETRKGSD